MSLAKKINLAAPLLKRNIDDLQNVFQDTYRSIRQNVE